MRIVNPLSLSALNCKLSTDSNKYKHSFDVVILGFHLPGSNFVGYLDLDLFLSYHMVVFTAAKTQTGCKLSLVDLNHGQDVCRPRGVLWSTNLKILVC